MQKGKKALAVSLIALAFAAPVVAQQQSSRTVKIGPTAASQTRTEAEIASLLREFLSKVDDPAMHERFWADDLVYVGASGVVRTKQEIVKNVREEAENAKRERMPPDATYDAEDIRVRQHGDVAVLNFRLVAQTLNKIALVETGKTVTAPSYFRNSGVFVKRGGRWQAVSWQATRVESPPPTAGAAEQSPAEKH